MVKNIGLSASVAAVVTILIIAGLALVPADKNPVSDLGGKTYYSLINTGEGYQVDGTTVIDGSGNIDAAITSTTGTFSSTLTTSGVLNTEGGLVEGGVLTIATTSATYTLTEDELSDVRVISVSYNANSAALALTLPATSTMTTMLPSSGDTQTWIIDNLHTVDATTTTITAGTGIDIDGTTANDDIINGGVSGRLECWRLPNTDVRCIVEEMVDAG